MRYNIHILQSSDYSAQSYAVCHWNLGPTKTGPPWLIYDLAEKLNPRTMDQNSHDMSISKWQTNYSTISESVVILSM